MHAIKRRARQMAWNMNDPETKRNPFARVRSKSADRLLRDVEANPRSTPPGASPTGASTGGPYTEESNAINGQGAKKRHFWNKKKNDDQPMTRTTSSRTAGGTKKFPIKQQIRATVFGSWINVLLVCAPAGIALHFTSVSPVAIFVVNFIAIIPLAALLSYATEEIAMRVGETLGGLMNATFGNAVEVIVSIIALVQNKIIIVKTSLIGSILSNLLLVMGMCFFFGGVSRLEQYFNVTVAQTASSLLSLAVGSLVIPTAFGLWSQSGLKNEEPLSRGTAIILLTVYGCYLFFQLKSHVHLYNEPSKKVEKRGSSKAVAEGDVAKGLATMGANNAAMAGRDINPQEPEKSEEDADDDDESDPQLSVVGAVVTLCLATALVGVCAEFMVDSIDDLVKIAHMSPEFVGLILIPIVGNAAEHATAVTVAVKDKMDLAIGVAVGSSMQIALFVLPLMVIIGWIVTAAKGVEAMTLYFDGFQIAVLFVAVLLVNYLIADGKSHWLEGVLLMALYIIIAVAAWYYPVSVSVLG